MSALIRRLRARPALAAAMLAAAALFGGCATEPSYATMTLPNGLSFDPARSRTTCTEWTPEVYVCPRCTNSTSDHPRACIYCCLPLIPAH